MNKNAHDCSLAVSRLIDWTREYALPFWAQHGLDVNGGGYEQLHEDGSPDLVSLRRVRVQARQAYVYAHAGDLGWCTEARKISDHFWNYLTSQGMQGGTQCLENGYLGCAHLLSADGTLHDGLRDTYAQAFVILAGAWRYKAFKDRASLRIAIDSLAYLDTFLTAPNGGWYEGAPASLPRRQNPHMHMFEALMALYDATQDLKYLRRAQEIFDLLEAKFFNTKHQIITEFFDDDWQVVDGEGGPIEPGHMMEWSWLLREFSNKTSTNVDNLPSKLFTKALDIGRNPQTGLLYDNVQIDGTICTDMSRSWAQTEFLKACMSQVQAGYLEAMDYIPALIDGIFKYYLDVLPKGGWVDRVDASGKKVTQMIPASTFYHWMGAASHAQSFKNYLEN